MSLNKLYYKNTSWLFHRKIAKVNETKWYNLFFGPNFEFNFNLVPIYRYMLYCIKYFIWKICDV